MVAYLLSALAPIAGRTATTGASPFIKFDPWFRRFWFGACFFLCTVTGEAVVLLASLASEYPRFQKAPRPWGQSL